MSKRVNSELELHVVEGSLYLHWSPVLNRAPNTLIVSLWGGNMVKPEGHDQYHE